MEGEISGFFSVKTPKVLSGSTSDFCCLSIGDHGTCRSDSDSNYIKSLVFLYNRKCKIEMIDQMSHEKQKNSYYRDPFIVLKNPHITGQYNTVYIQNNLVLFSLLKWSPRSKQIQTSPLTDPSCPAVVEPEVTPGMSFSGCSAVALLSCQRLKNTKVGRVGSEEIYFSMDNTVDGSEIHGASCYP